MLGLGLANYVPIVVYTIGIVVIFVTVFYKVEIGILLLVGLSPLQNVMDKVREFPFGKDLIDILMLAMIIGWVRDAITKRGRILERTTLNLPIFLYIMTTYVALWIGSFYLGEDLPINLSDSRFMNWKNLVLLPILYLITVNNITDLKWLKFLVVAMLFSTVLADFSFYKEFRWVQKWHYSHSMRVTGPYTYLGPNELGAFFAQYSMIIIGLILFLAKKLERFLLCFVFVFTIYALMYSFSRAGYLSFVLGVGFILFIKSKKLLIVFIILLCMSSWLLPVSVMERIEMTTLSEEEKIERGMSQQGEQGGILNGEEKFDASSESRFKIWEKSVEMFKKNPLFGAGFNTFIKSDVIGKPVDTHNNYLKILAELGMLGFFIYLYLYYLAFKSGWQLYKTSEERFLKGLGLGFAGCVIANMANNLTHDNWSYLNLMGFYWILLGLVVRGNLITQRLQQKEFGSSQLKDS